MYKLKFLNHASYALETENAILLHDPWFEGNAFNDGWGLKFQDMSNAEILVYLKNSKKKIFIWYSHEHSDHFNISFLKESKKENLNITILFQRTLDKRVVKFLKKNNFDVIECFDGKEYKLDHNFIFTVWRYSYLDSFTISNLNGIKILNINDCVIQTIAKAKKIKKQINKITNKIDILFTQFGYANWIGREEDKYLRLNESNEKLQRIFVQDKVFNPKRIIPFASFTYFSKVDNYYMNEEQNRISSLRNSSLLVDLQEKIVFMKPNQIVDLDKNIYEDQLSQKTKEAEKFWERLEIKIKNQELKIFEPFTKDFAEVEKVARSYITKINKECLLATYFFEKVGALGLRPLKILVYDLKEVFSLSYVHGFNREILESNESIDLSIHSNEIFFILNNAFGWDAMHISGSFRLEKFSNMKKIHNFFRWQNIVKNGFSYRKPLISFRVIINKLLENFQNLFHSC